MTRQPHLKDDRLFECYLAAHTGDLPDPRDLEHLAECAACTERYNDLMSFMGQLRDEADVALDAEFPAERLATQREQIRRRLTHLHRSARVLSFPGRDAAPAGTTTFRVPSRWLAAAAAAGLFIGVVVGGLLGPTGLRSRPTTPPMQVAAGPSPRVAAPAVRASVPVEPDDDAFLRQLDAALDSPQLRELQPFDALTPHVRDVGARVR